MGEAIAELEKAEKKNDEKNEKEDGKDEKEDGKDEKEEGENDENEKEEKDGKYSVDTLSNYTLKNEENQNPFEIKKIDVENSLIQGNDKIDIFFDIKNESPNINIYDTLETMLRLDDN